MSRRNPPPTSAPLPLYSIRLTAIPLRAAHGPDRSPLTYEERDRIGVAVRDAINLLQERGAVEVSGTWGPPPLDEGWKP